MNRPRLFSAIAVAVFVTAGVAAQVTKEAVPGVTNFAKVGTTIACAGATTPEAVAEVKKLGYKSIINLRQPTENGANIEAEQAAAQAAGLRYISLPLTTASPEPPVIEKFIVAVQDPANQPVFVHCASGNRAAALWMIKRITVDKWDDAKATEEAAALGLTNQNLKTFALDYAHQHSH